MTRNGAPGLGASSGPYLQKGEIRVNAGFTHFETDEEFRGVQHRVDLESRNTQVKEGTATLDLSAGVGLSRQLSLNVAAPIVLFSHWSTALAGTRYDQTAHGIADMFVGANWWLMNCEKYPEKNLSFGVGFRLPTGNSNVRVLYPNNLGQDFQLRPVFPGIQPGSGAWGWQVSVNGFQQVKRFFVYGTGIYTFSLKDQNSTYALGVTLNPLGITATRPDLRFISTPDSYLFNLGIGTPVPKVSRLTMFVNGRVAGVPVHNVLTKTQGFRQPGYFVTIEPGISFATSLASYSISAPLRLQAATRNNFLNQPTNSDFTRHLLVFSVNFKLGGKKGTEADLGPIDDKGGSKLKGN